METALLFLILALSIILAILIAFATCKAFKMEKAYKKLANDYEELYYDKQKLQMTYDTLKREKNVLMEENKQLKSELIAERKVIQANNIKSVEELPRVEKVSKPRGRKPKTTK